MTSLVWLHAIPGRVVAQLALTIAAITLSVDVAWSQTRFNVLVLAENSGHHQAFTQQAKPWLDSLARATSIRIDYESTTDKIDSLFLTKYAVILQLDYPPYGWKEKAERAFETYMEQGLGGWVGLHHASLLGEFDGYPMWDWFFRFMGSIRFSNYVPGFAAADVVVEQSNHPVMKGVPKLFHVDKEEWYIYDKSPRANVTVLAHVDEQTYEPPSKIKMGDHPVIWTNDKMAARNVYIFMGHSPNLMENKAYRTILRNAIFWAAGEPPVN